MGVRSHPDVWRCGVSVQGMLKVLVRGYPDRLAKVYCGNVNAAIRIIYRMLKPLMPRRLPGKVRRGRLGDVWLFVDESFVVAVGR